jgi:hypothetical protein
MRRSEFGQPRNFRVRAVGEPTFQNQSDTYIEQCLSRLHLNSKLAKNRRYAGRNNECYALN